MSDGLEILEWYVEAGIDVCLSDAPIDRFSETPPPVVKKTASTSSAISKRLGQNQKPEPKPSSVANVTVPDGSVVEDASRAALSADTLEALKSVMENFEGCNLKRTAKNLVFSTGNPDARVMFIGDAPNREEDLEGSPFIGQSGQLLDRMLAAIGLDREAEYFAPIISWRPPGNRKATQQEIEICRPFIERHIQLVSPDFIVIFGDTAAKTLLKTNDTITRLRGQWRKLSLGESSFQTLPTLHPEYLLAQPSQKNLAWQDLLSLQQALSKPSGSNPQSD